MKGCDSMLLSKDCIIMLKILRDKYKNKRQELRDSGNNSDKKLFVETMFLKYVYNDIVFISKIPYKRRNERYIFEILRSTVEQVIIIKFLRKRYEKDKKVFGLKC